MSETDEPRCGYEWNPGVWPYVARCALYTGHDGPNHVALSRHEIAVER